AFLVQREVADRLTASPGEAEYGGLSVLVAARASARRLATVRPGSFVPPPAVTSAFVGLERTAPPVDEAEWAGFANFVRTAFRQRRKTLVNNFRPSVGRLAAEAAVSALNLPPTARAESLGVSEFVALFRKLYPTPSCI
ncbi:MAG: 16S rRNA (adenine(1518)-N(6)/adenine(1519)-N(6))-dimethyltransferase, partial [Acidobacteria bacterium]|nr:16S rRNA (adenine(1518)-N(6)/adenine(1519)-N(6))-dimethyltransferase [Acidobacteriota bacterium]